MDCKAVHQATAPFDLGGEAMLEFAVAPVATIAAIVKRIKVWLKQKKIPQHELED